MNSNRADGLIELEGKDGTARLFRPAAFVPMDGETYLVLIGEKLNEYGEEDMLFACLKDDGNDVSFEVIEDGKLIRKVYAKYCAALEK